MDERAQTDLHRLTRQQALLEQRLDRMVSEGMGGISDRPRTVQMIPQISLATYRPDDEQVRNAVVGMRL